MSESRPHYLKLISNLVFIFTALFAFMFISRGAQAEVNGEQGANQETVAFNLVDCQRDRGPYWSYREAEAHVPSHIDLSKDEVARHYLSEGAAFIAKECQFPGKGTYENIVVVLKRGQQYVTARNYNNDSVEWSEYNNDFLNERLETEDHAIRDREEQARLATEEAQRAEQERLEEQRRIAIEHDRELQEKYGVPNVLKALERLFEGFKGLSEGKYSPAQQQALFERDYKNKKHWVHGQISDIMVNRGSKIIRVEVKPGHRFDVYPSFDFDVLAYSKGSLVTFVGRWTHLATRTSAGSFGHNVIEDAIHPE